MVLFINNTDFMGTVLNAGITNITGSTELAFLAIIIVFFAFFISFKVDLTWTILIMVPMVLIFGFYSGLISGIFNILLVLIAVGVIFYSIIKITSGY